MPSDHIRVGLIGASPERGWAKGAHVPAIKAVPLFSITAVCTSRRETADAAASQWGASAAYTDARQLVADPTVDLVVVCVKVPDHYGLVRAALEAGKPVFCEWPLAANMEEVRDLASLASAKRLNTFIGLQARGAPVLAYARDLVAQGYVGRVLGATVVSAAAGTADVTDLAHAYAADSRQGNSALTIAGGHTLDALCFVLGEFRELSAVVKTQHSKLRIVETGETLDKNSPDQVSVAGLLECGAVVSAHIQAGVSRGPGVRLEIRGDEGDLCISSAGPHIVEMTELRLQGARGKVGAPPGTWWPFEYLPVPASYRIAPAGTPDGPVFNVAQLYAMIASELRGGPLRAPDIQLALRRHELLDAIQRASDTGLRQRM